MSYAIKLPFRLDSVGDIVDADGVRHGYIFHPARHGEQIVAALNRPDLAPALAALEAVARKARIRNSAAWLDADSMLDQATYRNDADAKRRACEYAAACMDMDREIVAALALAGATLDGKDGKP